MTTLLGHQDVHHHAELPKGEKMRTIYVLNAVKYVHLTVLNIDDAALIL